MTYKVAALNSFSKKVGEVSLSSDELECSAIGWWVIDTIGLSSPALKTSRFAVVVEVWWLASTKSCFSGVTGC